MKKIEYQRPEIEVTKLNLEYLLGGASGEKNDGTHIIDWGGEDDGTHEPSAKGFWDDEEDY